MAGKRSRKDYDLRRHGRTASSAKQRKLGRALADLFPGMPPEQEPCAAWIYQAVFGDLPLGAWEKVGTTIRRFVDDKVLHFAPRRTYCTIGFRGRAAMEFYRFRGGECAGGEVTIKIPYDREFDPIPIRDTVEWYLYAS